jgi:ABC-type multidrug transport system fused ATPase/permease subunit
MNIAKQTVQLYWQHLRKHKVSFSLSLILAGAGVIVGQFLVPLIVALSVDKLVALQGQSFSIADQFGWLLGGLAILLLVEIILWRVQNFILWGMETDVMKELVGSVFNLSSSFLLITVSRGSFVIFAKFYNWMAGFAHED